MQKFGRYEVIKLVGEGAMGRVFLAKDPVLKRLVAIKVIALDRFCDDKTKEEFLGRFSIEAQASAKLNHPSIVTIYDTGKQDKIPWIAFEYIKGESLDIRIKKGDLLQFDQIYSIILQIASALKHAHENNIIHRDIKPGNILIDYQSGIAKLSDFGVVKAPDIGLTQSGSSIGSPGYMSPEQIESSKVDFKSDMFSLGVVIYEMVTGKHPFFRETVPAIFYATLNGEYTPLLKIRPDTPSNLKYIVSNLLNPQKENRTLTVEQIIELLNKEKINFNIHKDTQFNKSLQSPNDVFKFFVNQFLNVFPKKNLLFQKIVLLLSKFSNLIKFSTRILIKKLSSSLNSIFKDFGYFFYENRSVKKMLFSVFIVFVLIVTILISGKLLIKDSKHNALPSNIVNRLDHFIENGMNDSARTICNNLEKHHTLWKILFRGLIEFREKNYTESSFLLKKLINNNGRPILNSKIPYLRNEIEKEFKKGEAPDELIDLAVTPLLFHEDSSFLQMLNNEHYWIRWNAAKVTVAGRKTVDSISLYILDFKTASTYKARMRSVENLGTSEDPRAIPYLEKAAARGFRDPFVASKAKKYLRIFFQKK